MALLLSLYFIDYALHKPVLLQVCVQSRFPFHSGSTNVKLCVCELIMTLEVEKVN